MPDHPDIIWEIPLDRSGLGGIAATETRIVFGDRDVDDFHDVWRCLNAETGEEIWHVDRLAIGALDYGNSPRTSPLIDGDRVYCLGAHGDLLCVSMADGSVAWEMNLREKFRATGELPWGYCGSPLLVNGRLVVNPGASDASLVGLNAKTGAIEWKCPGAPPSYGSFRLMQFGDHQQIVGHDKTTLGGWNAETGKRLWTVTPGRDGDFNVPTADQHMGRLLIATENNGARLYNFNGDGRIKPEPSATNDRLRPDMSSGVVVNDRFYCVNRFLYCLDLNDNLNELWRIRDSSLADYGSIIASGERVLVVGKGKLLLLKADGTQSIISATRVFEENLPLYSHPAIAGDRLYIRGETSIRAIQL